MGSSLLLDNSVVIPIKPNQIEIPKYMDTKEMQSPWFRVDDKIEKPENAGR